MWRFYYIIGRNLYRAPRVIGQMRKLTPVTTQVHFLPPIYYEAYKDLKTIQIADLVRRRIVHKIDEVMHEAR